MSTPSKKVNFSESDEGRDAMQQLQEMIADSIYMTKPSYSANTALYPNNLIPFVDKHMEYMRSHPTINPQQYLSNLRLITRLKIDQKPS